jgi:hypothetical protein
MRSSQTAFLMAKNGQSDWIKSVSVTRAKPVLNGMRSVPWKLRSTRSLGRCAEPCENLAVVRKTISSETHEQVMVAYDLRFYEKLPKLAPHNPAFRDLFANNPELAEVRLADRLAEDESLGATQQGRIVLK